MESSKKNLKDFAYFTSLRSEVSIPYTFGIDIFAAQL